MVHLRLFNRALDGTNRIKFEESRDRSHPKNVRWRYKEWWVRAKQGVAALGVTFLQLLTFHWMALQLRSLHKEVWPAGDAERRGVSSWGFVWVVCSRVVWMPTCTMGKHSVSCSIKSIRATSIDARGLSNPEEIRRRSNSPCNSSGDAAACYVVWFRWSFAPRQKPRRKPFTYGFLKNLIFF